MNEETGNTRHGTDETMVVELRVGDDSTLQLIKRIASASGVTFRGNQQSGTYNFCAPDLTLRSLIETLREQGLNFELVLR